MSYIDLVILGIVLEKPQRAYEIQKDVEYHHLSRQTKISVPSIYRKVIQLSEKGYLQSDIVKGDRFADKAVYSITDSGKRYCDELMTSYVSQSVPLLDVYKRQAFMRNTKPFSLIPLRSVANMKLSLFLSCLLYTSRCV